VVVLVVLAVVVHPSGDAILLCYTHQPPTTTDPAGALWPATATRSSGGAYCSGY